MKQHLATMLDALINDDNVSAEQSFQHYMVAKTQEHLKVDEELTEGSKQKAQRAVAKAKHVSRARGKKK